MCSHPKQKTCVKHSRSNTDEILAYFQTFRTHKWEKKTTESRSFNNYSLVLNGPAWASLVAAQWWRIHLPMQETQVWSWVGKIPWRRKWQTHSSILAWEIPWIVEPGGLQSMGSQRVGHNLATEQQYQTGSSGILSSFPDSEIITTSLKGKTDETQESALVWYMHNFLQTKSKQFLSSLIQKKSFSLTAFDKFTHSSNKLWPCNFYYRETTI